MPETSFLHALILGIIEGATEFLPVSSTGHLVIAGDMLGFDAIPGEVFETSIQIGAILAICTLYRERLQSVVTGLFTGDPAARRFTIAIVLATLPMIVLGAVFYKFIVTVLFTPLVVATAFILGGAAIIAIERLRIEEKVHEVEELGSLTALKIGAFQCLALIPGMSRAGATIIGARIAGVERKAAAEFSFFLAIPVIVGATIFDVIGNRELINGSHLPVLAIGFVTAFLSALVVVKWFVGFVSRHGFEIFGWYRIGFGGLLIAYYILMQG
ncbi:MAG: undecaprenyl-diphosphate phosphatase [Parvibaculum sp.]|nr:undecaprenyl-diphosphate phosphatase [Parvibaculum sp.]